MSEHTGPDREATPEELQAIETARRMAAAGIPIFVCPPNPYKPGKFFFKAGWQHTEADPAALDRWRPGWGVAAVGGGAADFLDIDPRSGGDESQLLLKNEGAWPLTYGTQSTPSGGTHHIISRTGERKETGFLPGIDFQAGAPEPDEQGSHGRAFVWLAPTVGRSKVTGELVPYRWVAEPDLEGLDEWRAPDGTSSDASTEGIVARVHAHRALRASHSAQGAQAPAQGAEAGQGASRLFSTEPYGGGAAPLTRSFTVEQARAFAEPHLQALREAPIGQIEERGMQATLALEHFVPSHLTAQQAHSLIVDALSHTAYDPNGPSDWTADKFLARLDGRRPVAGSWKATLTQTWPEPPATPTGRLRRAMHRRSEVHALPDPVPLIEHVLFRNSVTVLAGQFGTYKSFVAVGWACSLATGRPWFGFAVPEPVPVIYAAAEGAAGIKRRLDAWERAHGVTVPDSLYLISVSVRLNRPEDVRELDELITETGAKALIFDTFHASTPGLDENDSGGVGMIYDTLRGLQERHGVAPILPHHTGHGGERSRGSSSIEDDADTSFVIKLKGEGRGPEVLRTMEHRKTKDEALLPKMDLALALVEGTGSGYVVRRDDAFTEAEVAPVEIGQEEHTPDPVPGDWTWSLIDHNTSTPARRVLMTIRHIAGESGRTEAQVKAAVLSRWYDGKPLRKGKAGHMSPETWSKAWTTAVAAIGQGGEPAVVNVGAGRYAINPSALLSDD